jgi:hypothetical protein
MGEEGEDAGRRGESESVTSVGMRRQHHQAERSLFSCEAMLEMGWSKATLQCARQGSSCWLDKALSRQSGDVGRKMTEVIFLFRHLSHSTDDHRGIFSSRVMTTKGSKW